MAAPEVESLAWEEQLAVDDESYRTQLAYLFERSAFYREKLAAAGFDSPQAAGGLADVVRDRTDLLDERHHRRAQLRPAHGGRSRQLGDGVGPQLRSLGHRRWP